MQSPIANRIDTVFIHVTDLTKSVQWYSKLLGVEVTEEIQGPIYTFDMGSGRPGLTLDNHCFDDSYELQPLNQPLFNLSTEDIHAAFQFVKELGAEIVTEIQTYPDLSEFSFKDPDGNIVMICTCFS
ncbi:glyoxalase/bleomycin resistance/dioxygenase family protein [Paenibacillus sp. 7541]|uniref:Glyoxalase/bleomycin resistance/dioxygenase family protein n=2 Tax=Paenibacillus TaxID=44249 RepID=A0A268EEC6_9BACL|nr:VOC family protein [Paenibacillus campinasensis]PAD71475.1 glyoxalase/bleomycin resistance/dioxygenase family protein [Paenibacillus campinasensis]PAK47987.1 glyoxalase/bleomycin resistance/dioxygenase family protein [Paenibacillus sp. 7541]